MTGSPGDDLRARLELVDEALLAIAGNIANGRAPADDAERDRCRLVAERIAGKGRRVVDQLARPPAMSQNAAPSDAAAAGPEARVVAETNRILDEARDREQGEEP